MSDYQIPSDTNQSEKRCKGGEIQKNGMLSLNGSDTLNTLLENLKLKYTFKMQIEKVAES